MKRRIKALPRGRKPNVKAIRFYSDYQTDWHKFIPSLKKYELKKITFLTVMGDAPKDFTSDKEFREGHRTRRDRTERFIAKVGSKYYPNESITEQLLTRIGQYFKLSIATSKLRMIDGQVRFMSKYFLRGNSEQLNSWRRDLRELPGKERISRNPAKEN